VSGRRPPAQAIAATAIAAMLVAVAFTTGEGVDELAASPGNTWTEIALLLIGVLVVGVACFRAPAARRRWGVVTVSLMALLFALSAASIAWSVVPDSSWLASGQLLAYLAVFAAGVALARLAPGRWPALLGGLALACVALCGWSLLVKVFPATLAPGNEVGRLEAPFGYWNAIAVSAAIALPCCMWLGARRDGGRHLAPLAAPALALVFAVLVLSYSRSADLAAAVAAGVWLVFVPLRLRAAAWLLLGGLGGAVISVWALTHHDLTAEKVPPAFQDSAGHTFGIVIAAVLVVMAVAGVVLAVRMARVQLTRQRRWDIGAALLGIVVLGAAAAVVGVATSSRGLTGEISYGWHELTNPQATVSATSAGRVFDFGSSRPLYWHQALDVGDHAVFKGTGLLGFSEAHLRYPSNVQQAVFQAHSYVFETYADLGILGLAVTAALLLAWLSATGRALELGRRWSTLTPAEGAERAGLATLAVVVVGFGVQSTLDWTWFFTGVSVPALLAAGWLAGRGRPSEPAPAPAPASPLDRTGAIVGVPLLVALALAACWMMWRPLHTAQLISSIENGTAGNAVAAAQSARSADPLSLLPYQTLAAIDEGDRHWSAARAELTKSTQVQPQNPYSWAALAQFYVQRKQWKAAIPSLHQVAVLDQTPDAMTNANNAEIATVFRHYTPPAAG
jgi:hypothetical protein